MYTGWLLFMPTWTWTLLSKQRLLQPMLRTEAKLTQIRCFFTHTGCHRVNHVKSNIQTHRRSQTGAYSLHNHPFSQSQGKWLFYSEGYMEKLNKSSSTCRDFSLRQRWRCIRNAPEASPKHRVAFIIVHTHERTLCLIITQDSLGKWFSWFLFVCPWNVPQKDHREMNNLFVVDY